jgi:hypothetical protein
MGYFNKIMIAVFLGAGYCGSEFTVAYAAEVVDEAHHLKVLEGLVGDWTGETSTVDGKPVTLAITYEWLYDRKYLLAHVERRTEGVLVKSTLVYLWDPEVQKIRLWFISSDGSWNQATVEIDQGKVLLDTKGINAEGKPFSMITDLGHPDQAVRIEEFRHVIVGGIHEKGYPRIVWKRKAAR